MDTLSFGLGHRQGFDLGHGAFQTGRHYVDFVVSGQSLKALIGRPKLELMGTIGWAKSNEWDSQQIDEYLCKVTPELETGRTCFYVCPECGHVGCGAITAKIITTDNKVIWKNFAFETDYSPPDFTDFKDIRQFEFDKIQYVQAFEKLRKDLKEKINLG